MTSRSGWVAAALMNPATDSPTPVRTPSNGVASIATTTGPATSGMGPNLRESGGTARSPSGSGRSPPAWASGEVRDRCVPD